MKVTREIYNGKIEAYNVAIDALRAHESESDPPSGMGAVQRNKLADQLDRQIQRWVERTLAQMKDIFVRANEARLAGEPKEFWLCDYDRAAEFFQDAARERASGHATSKGD